MRDLGNRKPDQTTRDLDYVVESLETLDYAATAHLYQAAETGSLAERGRYYFRGIAGQQGRHQGEQRAKLQFCHMLMNQVRIPMLPPTVFFGGSKFLVFDEVNASDREEKGGCRLVDPGFGDMHIDA